MCPNYMELFRGSTYFCASKIVKCSVGSVRRKKMFDAKNAPDAINGFPRLSLLQAWSFKIRRTTFLN